MILGVMAPVELVIAAVIGLPVTYMLFGMSHQCPALVPMPVLLAGMVIGFGICAYGLLIGKVRGLAAGLFTGYVRPLFVVVSTVLGLIIGAAHISLEPIIQLPYLIKLHQLRNIWYGYPGLGDGRDFV